MNSTQSSFTLHADPSQQVRAHGELILDAFNPRALVQRKLKGVTAARLNSVLALMMGEPHQLHEVPGGVMSLPASVQYNVMFAWHLGLAYLAAGLILDSCLRVDSPDAEAFADRAEQCVGYLSTHPECDFRSAPHAGSLQRDMEQIRVATYKVIEADIQHQVSPHPAHKSERPQRAPVPRTASTAVVPASTPNDLIAAL